MTGRRGVRRLLLAAIGIVLIGVGGAYRIQKRLLQQQSPRKPAVLPLHLNASAEEWLHTTSRPDGRPLISVRARDFRQIKESGLVELEHVELRLYHEEADRYDLVKSERAEFRPAERSLYSEGAVEITLAVPSGTGSSGRLISIRSSGVKFDTATGKATTERPASFVFENGDGRCVGASYDPNGKELLMYSQVQVDWRAKGPHPRNMRIETDRLSYKEAQSAIILFPWARLTQGPATIHAGDTIVTLDEGLVRRVEAQRAKGEAKYPRQVLEYSADHLFTDFTAEGAIGHVTGEPNARLVSTTPTSRTTVSCNRIDLEFETSSGESVLKSALARGAAVVESTPAAAAADVRTLRSETIETTMRAGGQEIERVETHAPGRIDFLPRVAGRRRRQMEGERISILYGPDNQIQSFRSVNVATRTEPPQGAKGRAPVQTWSKDLLAEFDPRTGQMKRMEQWRDFRYQEGNRQATAARAVFDPEPDVMTLETGARMWDPDGSTSGDVIQLDQKTGRFTVQGHVNSSRAPDSRAAAGRPDEGPREGAWQGLLGGKEPVQAMAERMVSENRNMLIRYEGHAVLWQGGNRVQAGRIVIDRAQRRLTAAGDVISQLADAQPAEGTAPVFTVVRAANLVYTDADRRALYTGQVALSRPDLAVNCERLEAFLAEAGEESRLDRLFADGRVRVVQAVDGSTRTGTGEHAEYYTAEQRIVLRGGNPVFVDSRRGTTRGAELTYFTGDDRLLVSGAPKQPATSRIPRK